MGKIWDNDRVMQKMLKRYLDGKCVSCGHKPCSCKSKGKIRNRKAIGKNESHEPNVKIIPTIAEQLERS